MLSKTSRGSLSLILLTILLMTSCHTFAAVLDDIRQLSDAAMQGRKTGSAGAKLAQVFITERFEQLGLKPFEGKYQRAFVYGAFDKTGINLVGYRQGCTYPEHYIVITAHYDHLGKQGRKIFHGADDNASGVAAMLDLASKLTVNCPAYSYIFVATDAEESGLYGSKAFVAAPPVALKNIVLNINLDMVSRPDRWGRLYLTGAKPYPGLIATLSAQHPKLKYLSHRGPGIISRDRARNDWPNASDHGPFYRADIPYLFFGGQEHPQYHTDEDQWQRIEPEFLDTAMQAIWHSVQWLEQQPPSELAFKKK
jgi:Zn-dependent M28 family amino/carboxypeptidase